MGSAPPPKAGHLHERERDDVEYHQRPDLRRWGGTGSDDDGQYRQVVDGRQRDPQARHCRDPQRRAVREASCSHWEFGFRHNPSGQKGSHQQREDSDHDLDLGQGEVCRPE